MTIILAEKPQAGRKIESATGIKTIPLAGHLLELKKQDFRWTPPYFKVEWVPKKGKKEKLNSIKDILNDHDNILIATDYDAEGQLIALNVLRYSNIDYSGVGRMKFSSLEEDELLRAYKNPIEFDLTFALQAEVRHFLDWYFGMNISKTITILRQSKQFLLTPVGRVQTPTLSYLVEREKEIGEFVSKEIWYTDVYGLYGENNNKTFKIGRFSFESREHAENYMEDNMFGEVDHIDKTTYLLKQYPPNTDWMMRYGMGIGLSANIIAKMLQDLYLNEYCSYPRTDSEQYTSQGVNTQKYLERLVNVVDGAEDALGKQPLEGEKTDVHPAIYPINVYPEKDVRGILWKKIANCFVKCHLPPERIKYETLYVDINGETSVSTENPEDLPVNESFELSYNLKKGKLAPPSRYKQRAVYDWMTNHGIGTRDTRPLILTKVLKRYAYETKKGIFLTSLGMKIVTVLQEYCPELVSTDLTKTFGKQISELKQGKKVVDILSEGKKVVTELVENLFENKEKIITQL